MSEENTLDWLDKMGLGSSTGSDIQVAENIPIIRTSDRLLYRRCRRKWFFFSKLRQGLQVIDSASYFWAGSLGHFALEDYHGYNKYGDPISAMHAAVKAQKLASTSKKRYLPPDWEEQFAMIKQCVEYYLEWLEYRDPLNTLWIDGVPQVEVRAWIPIVVNGQLVYYDFTCDRAYETDDGTLGLIDYKFMKQFSSFHLDTDTQVSAYCWLASVYYQRPVTEFTYQQHLKTNIDAPRRLVNGGISVNKNQKTSYIQYSRAMEEVYGSINASPQANKVFLNNLIDKESDEADAYIRRDVLYRNEHQSIAQGNHALLEAEEMLDPNLRIYPNHTRDCGWDCGMLDLCVMMDDGSDWEPYLSSIFETQPEKRDAWRDHLE